MNLPLNIFKLWMVYSICATTQWINHVINNIPFLWVILVTWLIRKDLWLVAKYIQVTEKIDEFGIMQDYFVLSYNMKSTK